MGFVSGMLTSSVDGSGKLLDNAAFYDLCTIVGFWIRHFIYLHPGIPPEPAIRAYYEICTCKRSHIAGIGTAKWEFTLFAWLYLVPSLLIVGQNCVHSNRLRMSGVVVHAAEV